MLSYLFELRRRLLTVLIVFLCLFAVLFFLAPHLFLVLMHPLLSIGASKPELVATGITAPLLVPIKLAANAALLLTVPFALLQLWRFVTPGLYRREKKLLGWTVTTSVCLFLIGALFCFYLILPFLFKCFVNATPEGVRYLPDITLAADFITRMLLLFGLSFQLPLLCVFLASIQLVRLEQLITLRPYVIVGAFIVGMLLTPPDVLSQILLAVPLCLLYELGILGVRWFALENNSRENTILGKRSLN